MSGWPFPSSPEARAARAAAAIVGCDVQAMAVALVAEANRRGIVLTVEQMSLHPPAMGHYLTVVSVRPARERAA